METQEQTKTKRLRIAIIILAVLLVLSAVGLAARYIYLAFFAPTQATVTVPDNLIGEENPEPEGNTDNGSRDGTTALADTPGANDTGSSGADGTSDNSEMDNPLAAKLELYQGKPEDNRRFEVSNMLPGDSVTKYFCVKASHDANIELFFKADITEQTKSLGDALHIKVTHMETGKVLCDAAFSEVNGREFAEFLEANSDEETTAYYQIDVSLDTSVGNEYQAAMLKADFEWFVKDQVGLIPPQTGDNTNIILWIVIAASSFLILLLFGRRRKEDKRHG